MTRILAESCRTAAEFPALYLATHNSADRVVREIQAAERAAGEPPTGREAIAAALLAALRGGGIRDANAPARGDGRSVAYCGDEGGAV